MLWNWIERGTEDAEQAAMLRRVFTGKGDAEDGAKAFAWLLVRSGFWDRSNDDPWADGRRDLVVQLLDAMGVSHIANAADLAEHMLSTSLPDKPAEPTDTEGQL
jgi:hypothetical protein